MIARFYSHKQGIVPARSAALASFGEISILSANNLSSVLHHPTVVRLLFSRPAPSVFFYIISRTDFITHGQICQHSVTSWIFVLDPTKDSFIALPFLRTVLP